jgi:hypothetical protein
MEEKEMKDFNHIMDTMPSFVETESLEKAYLLRNTFKKLVEDRPNQEKESVRLARHYYDLIGINGESMEKFLSTVKSYEDLRTSAFARLVKRYEDQLNQVKKNQPTIEE